MQHPARPTHIMGTYSDALALSRLAAKTPAEVCTRAKMPAAALACLHERGTLRDYLEQLLQQKMFPEAERYLAFGLPPRDGIWWGSLALRHLQPTLAGPQATALHAVVNWVLQPDEKHRQAVEPFAGTSSAAAFLAQAVAWTGGSLFPPRMPVVKPKLELPHEGLLAALTLAVASVPPPEMEKAHRQVIALGMQVARGKFLWSAPVPGSSNRPRS
ncbi:MAG: hypothetical protein U0840_02445 [Gemmataceae bacterium]